MAADDRVQVARPTINIGGKDDSSLAEGLLNLMVTEDTTGLFRCEATFGNWGTKDNNVDFLYFDRRLLDFGKNLKLKIGPDIIFDGLITGLEGGFPPGQPPEFTVLAEDRFQELRMTRRTRSFADMSDAAVIRQIANDHSLTPDVSLNGPTYRVLTQVNQSDLAFMRERARSVDGELWMDGNTLKVKSHSQRNGETLTLSYGNELREVTILADLAMQRTSVTCSGWDVAGKTALKYEATDTVIGSELQGRDSGAKVLKQAFGPRKEALAHHVTLTSQEAQSVAESYFKLQARRFLTAQGVAQPNGKLRVGNFIDLKEVGPLFTGKYYLTEVRHIFDGEQGMFTEFTAEAPGLGH